jgi:hypothetical protein
MLFHTGSGKLSEIIPHHPLLLRIFIAVNMNFKCTRIGWGHSRLYEKHNATQ